MSARKVSPAALVAAVGLLTAETNDVAIDPADLIGTNDPADVVHALVLVGSVLVTVLGGAHLAGVGLRAAGRTAAEAAEYGEQAL